MVEIMSAGALIQGNTVQSTHFKTASGTKKCVAVRLTVSFHRRITLTLESEMAASRPGLTVHCSLKSTQSYPCPCTLLRFVTPRNVG